MRLSRQFDQLFDPGPAVPRKRSWFHASEEPAITDTGGEFHVGTRLSAEHRAIGSESGVRGYIHRLNVRSPVGAAGEDPGSTVGPAPGVLTSYENVHEDPGSTSLVGSLSRDFDHVNVEPIRDAVVRENPRAVILRNLHENRQFVQHRLFRVDTDYTTTTAKPGKRHGWDRT